MATLSAIFKGVDQLSSVLDRMGDSGTDALNQWEDSMKAADEAFSRASEGADRAAEAATGAADAAGLWTDQIGNYDREAMEAIYTTEELVEMGYKTEDALHDAADAADQAADAVEEYGDEAEEAGDQSEEFGGKSTQAVQSLAGILTSAGVVVMVKEIAQAFYEASEAAAEYETYLAKVSTIADPAQASLSTISGEITALSMDTGKAVTELSDATYQALSAGVETANAVSFAGTATELAVGGFTTAATAVDVLTTALNAYGLEATYAENISDMLVTTQNLGKTTVDELASNMGRVIPLASAYGVEMDNLSTGYAVMTANGIATAETTTYLKSMLNELGTTSSTVAGVLLDETGMSFADLTAAGYSLGDVLDILGESVDGNTTAFNELWGSQEAGVGALSLYNAGAERFNTVLDEMRSSAGAAATAYDAMTDTTEHGAERMANSFNNLQISVGTVLNPTFDAFYNTVADGTDALTSFINEHPAVVAGVTAIGVGLGVATIALTGFTFATQVAKPAIISFAATLNTALGPIGWVTIGVTAAVAAITALVALLPKAEDETEGMTASTSAQYYELQDLNVEYEKAVKQYGDTSEEALRLRYEVDELTAAFEENQQTVEEFTAACDSLVQSHNELVQGYQESITEIGRNEAGTLSLIQRLDDLTVSTDNTAASEEEMRAIIAALNEEFPDLAMTYEDVANSTTSYADALKAACEAQAEQERYAESQRAYTDLVKEQADITNQLAAAEENVRLERQAIEDAGYNLDAPLVGWSVDLSDLKAYEAAVEELTEAQKDNQAQQAVILEQWEDIARAAEEAANAEVTAEEGVTRAVAVVSEEVGNLAAKYEEAYAAALESVQGQYSLWDEAADVVATSASTINSALDSQASYWQEYDSNLQSLSSRAGDIEGLQDVLASFADGSAESVNAVAGLAGASDEELRELVENYQNVQEAQAGVSESLGLLNADVDEQLTEIETRMEESVEKMNMAEEAKDSARAMIDAYVAAIREGIVDVEIAANDVSSVALNGLGLNSTVGVPGHAAGTDNAEPGLAMVGEEGPELVFFDGGETVLNASDTRQYLANQRPIQTSVPAPDAELEGGSIPGGERRIVLEIAGRGSLELTGGNVDEDAAAEWLMENLRPVLINTLKQEIFEEGDATNAY